jgi:hypothetical protein
VGSQGAIVASLFLPVPLRAVIWIAALIWMGTACILNAKRCGRTHCRYTRPFYLAMIAPVLALGSGILHADFLGWFVLAAIILAGSKRSDGRPNGRRQNAGSGPGGDAGEIGSPWSSTNLS